MPQMMPSQVAQQQVVQEPHHSWLSSLMPLLQIAGMFTGNPFLMGTGAAGGLLGPHGQQQGPTMQQGLPTMPGTPGTDLPPWMNPGMQWMLQDPFTMAMMSMGRRTG